MMKRDTWIVDLLWSLWLNQADDVDFVIIRLSLPHENDDSDDKIVFLITADILLFSSNAPAKKRCLSANNFFCFMKML